MTQIARPQVAVVVPTYNGEKYLEQAVQSVWNQTVPAAELIIVDDRSIDETVALAKRLEKNSPILMRVIQLPRNSGGPAGPMNIGIQESRSDVLAFLDQDDIMSPFKIELVAAMMWQDASVGLAFGQYGVIDECGQTQPPDPEFYAVFPPSPAILRPDEVFRTLVCDGYRFGGAGGTAIHRRVWVDLAGFDTRYRVCWDMDFALRAAIRGWSVGYLAQEVYRHRLHDGNLGHSESGKLVLVEEVAVLLAAYQAAVPFHRKALATALHPRLLGTAYFERKRRRYASALRYYWYAARWGRLVPAAVGATKVIADAILQLLCDGNRCVQNV